MTETTLVKSKLARLVCLESLGLFLCLGGLIGEIRHQQGHDRRITGGEATSTVEDLVNT